LQRAAAVELGAEVLRQFDYLAEATAITASVVIPSDLNESP
jgi:hypothetical protein